MNKINIAEVEKTGKHDNIANASSNLASTDISKSNPAENVKENSENEKSSCREFKGTPEQASREQLEKNISRP